MWYPQHIPVDGKVAAEEFYSTDFPRAVYRDAEPFDDAYLPSDHKERRAELDRVQHNYVQGHAVETRLVMNAADEEEALTSGWRLTVADMTAPIEPVRRGPGRPPRVAVSIPVDA